jgi:hypothetical protein
MASEIETNMVGVERIKEYQEIKEEAPLEMPDQDPPPHWPEYGVVKFENYKTRCLSHQSYKYWFTNICR